MRRLEAFSGVRVLTYALMSNHFHLLCEVPQAQELSEAELLDRIEAGYGPARRQTLDQELARLRQELRQGFGSPRLHTYRCNILLVNELGKQDRALFRGRW